MLRAVTSDMMARNHPSVVVGDFNAEVEATPFLQTLLGDPWQDLSGYSRGVPHLLVTKVLVLALITSGVLLIVFPSF